MSGVTTLVIMVYQGLAGLWGFITSNIVAVLGTFFAALLGASASHIISGRAKTKEEYRSQVRDTNTALALSLYVAEKLLDFKGNNVRPMKEAYEKQKTAYLKSLSTGVDANLGPVDLEELEVLDLPVVELRTIAYEKLFLTLPLQAAAVELVEMLGLMNKSIERHHAVLREMLKEGPDIDEKKKRILFAGPDANGNVDGRYSSAIEGIWHYLNWSIQHAMFLTERLPKHGEVFRRAYRKKGFLGKLPQIHEFNFAKANELGLVPTGEEFTRWPKKFVEREPTRPFLQRCAQWLRTRLGP